MDKEGFQRFKMKYLYLLIFILFGQKIISQDAATQIRIDSLNDILSNSGVIHDTTVVNAYLLLSQEFYVLDLDSTMSICKKALDITNKHLESNITKEETQSFLTTKAGLLNNIASVYYNRGDVPKTLEYFHASLKIEESLRNTAGIANAISNIGYIYYSNGDNEQALQYFDKALKLKKEINDRQGLAVTLNNIGLVYYSQGDTAKTVKYFLESLKIEESLGNKQGLADSYSNMAAIYRNQGLLDKAIEYFEKALKMSKEEGDDVDVSMLQRNLAVVFLDQSDLEKAEKYAVNSLELSRKLEATNSVKEAASLLSRIYKQQNKGIEALEMYKLYITMRDSIENMDAQTALLEQKLQYEFTQKESLIKAEHDKDLAIREAEEKKQEIIIWAISIGLIALIIFALLIGNRLRVSNKQKLIIEQKNKENELLLGEIHHRVKNNLQVVSSLLTLQERSITDPNAKVAILEGKERVQSMGLIHKLLYQENNFSGIEMNDYIEKLTLGLLETFGKNEKEFELDISFDKINIDIDTAIPLGLIINELIVNSLKYAYDKTNKPRLKINLREDNQQLVLEVEDNGPGKVEKIEGSKSFGMKLVKSLLRQLSGVIEIERREGLCFKIAISDYKII